MPITNVVKLGQKEGRKMEKELNSYIDKRQNLAKELGAKTTEGFKLVDGKVVSVDV